MFILNAIGVSVLTALSAPVPVWALALVWLSLVLWLRSYLVNR